MGNITQTNSRFNNKSVQTMNSSSFDTVTAKQQAAAQSVTANGVFDRQLLSTTQDNQSTLAQHSQQLTNLNMLLVSIKDMIQNGHSGLHNAITQNAQNNSRELRDVTNALQRNQNDARFELLQQLEDNKSKINNLSKSVSRLDSNVQASKDDANLRHSSIAEEIARISSSLEKVGSIVMGQVNYDGVSADAQLSQIKGLMQFLGKQQQQGYLQNSSSHSFSDDGYNSDTNYDEERNDDEEEDLTYHNLGRQQKQNLVKAKRAQVSTTEYADEEYDDEEDENYYDAEQNFDAHENYTKASQSSLQSRSRQKQMTSKVKKKSSATLGLGSYGDNTWSQLS